MAEECETANKRKEALLITRIDFPAGEPCIHGFVMEPHMASDFAHELGPAVAKLGWHLEAPNTNASYILNNGAPWEFKICFKDVLVVPEPAKKTLQSKRK